MLDGGDSFRIGGWLLYGYLGFMGWRFRDLEFLHGPGEMGVHPDAHGGFRKVREHEGWAIWVGRR